MSLKKHLKNTSSFRNRALFWLALFLVVRVSKLHVICYIFHVPVSTITLTTSPLSI